MTANTVNNFPLRPMKTPFAGTALISANTSSVGGINVSTLPATGDNVANVATGFPETFSTSITKGGKYIKRADVNAMGYIATIMAFRQQMGMPNEWNKQICDAIGGYPKGAVLDYCIWNGSVIQETYKITSLTDDNTEDPTTTAQANWKQWARVSVNAEYVSGQKTFFPRFEKTTNSDWIYTTSSSITIKQDSYVGVWVNGHYSGEYAAIYYTSPSGVGPVLVADRQKQDSNNDDEHYGIWYAFVGKGSVISMSGNGKGVRWRYFISPL